MRAQHVEGDGGGGWRVTAYGIKLAGLDQWAGDRRQWVDGPASAIRFDSMTRATIAAIEILGLAPEAFTVEAI